MPQTLFNTIWLLLFLVIVIVRKAHERQAGGHTTLKGTPPLEATLMVLWGLAASVLPLMYIFGSSLSFADIDFQLLPAPLGSLVPLLSGIGGSLLFLLAIWLLHRSHADLGHNWSPAVEPGGRPGYGSQLVTRGVYRRVRHPMYSAHLVWGVAQLLLLPNLIAGPLALLLMVAVIILRVPREEQAMLATFGDEYRHYMQQTGRVIPAG